MKAVLLNGSAQHDDTGQQVTITLTEQLQAAGWDVESIILRDKTIGICAGNFLCWVRTPGICQLDDDNRAIAAAIANCDLLVYLTPVTFGGYSPTLKRMVDHQIQNISPFFTQINGEIHHQRRYSHYPDFLVIGWLESPNPREEAIFRHLVHRNTLNFYAQRTYCGLTYAGQTAAERQSLVKTWLRELSEGTVSPVPALADTGAPAVETTRAPRRAILLVGSPRARKSTSHILGSYLMEQLAAHDVETETIQVYASLSSPEKTRALLEKLDTADLAVLAFPLYVDSLPAPVTALMEQIAAHRAGHSSEIHFAALVNCGFPEAHHNNTALAICEEFSRQAGMSWAGGLALGAGGVYVQGKMPDERDKRIQPITKALRLAADALANGHAIPLPARDLMAKIHIPAWLYRTLGNLGWKQQAKKFGSRKQLRRQSYR